MAKPKTKKAPMDTICTETAPGRWEWETGGILSSQKWAYENSWLIMGKERVAFFKNLDCAVSYTWGRYDTRRR